jgi:nucleotide-binding universal stress UspA family protein
VCEIAFDGAEHFEFLTTALPAAALEQDSVAAFKWALHNLYRAGDALHILHVLPDTGSSPASGNVFYAGAGAGDAEEEVSQVLQQAGEFIQSEFVGLAAARGVEVNVVLIKDSTHRHVGWAVCRKAEELEAAPLVLATHHKGYFAEMLLGSVSKFCAANCKQPVLLVHPDHSQVAW